jgi:hypothetical protein
MKVLDQPAGLLDELIVRVGILLAATSLVLGAAATTHLGFPE